MIQNQGQNHMNMHTGTIPQAMNHGAHEIMDVREVLSGAVCAMNQVTLLRQNVQDPELANILDRQYQFMQQEYNTTVECFQTGQDPAVPTQSYKMNQNNDFVYGLKPAQPEKPIQSASEITDQHISSSILGAHKSTAAMKTVAAMESTNPVVRRVLADSIPNCIEMAYEMSLYQNKHHYYQVPQFPEQDMQQMLNAYAPAQGQPQTMNQNMTH
jgi:spore coat protein CotF